MLHFYIQLGGWSAARCKSPDYSSPNKQRFVHLKNSEGRTSPPYVQCESCYLCNSLCFSLLQVHVKNRKKGEGSTDFNLYRIGQNCVTWSLHLEVRSRKRMLKFTVFRTCRQEKYLPGLLAVHFLMQSRGNSVPYATLWEGINMGHQ